MVAKSYPRLNIFKKFVISKDLHEDLFIRQFAKCLLDEARSWFLLFQSGYIGTSSTAILSYSHLIENFKKDFPSRSCNFTLTEAEAKHCHQLADEKAYVYEYKRLNLLLKWRPKNTGFQTYSLYQRKNAKGYSVSINITQYPSVSSLIELLQSIEENSLEEILSLSPVPINIISTTAPPVSNQHD